MVFLSLIISEFYRGESCVFLEQPAEVRRIIITYPFRYLIGLLVCIQKHSLGLFHSDPDKVIPDSHTGLFLEYIAEIILAERYIVGYFVQVDILLIILLEILAGQPDRQRIIDRIYMVSLL